MGVVAEIDSVHRIRKAKVGVGNNGFLIKQTLKKRIWWGLINN
jgi:hypothetical protein